MQATGIYVNDYLGSDAISSQGSSMQTTGIYVNDYLGIDAIRTQGFSMQARGILSSIEGAMLMPCIAKPNQNIYQVLRAQC